MFSGENILFMSVRPTLGHVLPIFIVFCQNCQKSQFFAQNCDLFVIFTFLVQNTFREATFNFRPILADIPEYTFKMISYHVTEAINGYF